MYTVQCPLDIANLDIASALLIATSTPVTDLRHYIKITTLSITISNFGPYLVNSDHFLSLYPAKGPYSPNDPPQSP